MALRFAGHLGVRAPDTPLFRTIAGSDDPLRQIALLAELGFSGVADNYMVLRPAAEQAAIGDAVARHGLAMGSFVHDPAGWNRPLWSADDTAGHDSLGQALNATLEAAKRSGSRTVNCITGHDPARDFEAQWRAMADNLAWAGDRAARGGVLLCVETTHPAFAPGLLLERFADTLALVDRVAHPHVRINLDVGHIGLHGADVAAAVRDAGSRIGLVQLADCPGRVEPGAGTLDWAGIIRALGDVGYAGLLELELEPAEPGEAGERALLERLRWVESLNGRTPAQAGVQTEGGTGPRPAPGYALSQNEKPMSNP